jgi:hypothetical protein
MSKLSKVMMHLAMLNQIGPFSFVDSGCCVSRSEAFFDTQLEKFIRNIPGKARARLLTRLQSPNHDPRHGYREEAATDVLRACAEMKLSAVDFEKTVERLATIRTFDTWRKSDGYVDRATYERWSSRYRQHGIAGLVPRKSSGRPRKSVDSTGE